MSSVKREGDLRRHMDHSARRQGSDRSPLHPQSKNRNGSPAWERKNSDPNGAAPAFAPSTPGHSRLSSGRTTGKQDEPLEKGAALPRFGDWNANDPSSADGFTMIFDKARVERRGGSVQPPPHSAKKGDDLYKNPERSSSSKGGWCCCFSSES